MHELSVVEKILAVVLAHAVKHRVKRVLAIHLEVGELSDLEDRWLQHYFDHVSKGSRAEKARLVIVRMPARLQCGACGHDFSFATAAEQANACPRCSSTDCRLIAGQGYFIKHLEAL
ncbi:MAG: hydrogenase maturation nickel metallochaperone HypA [Deltaproteobacteria bacterium]|nr:hydrogenase maturation nickel metallochaperone HypA [Deltaproteobacteria bacterium]